uniref:Polydeoxyribonucleotide synthase [ATP] n=1 Tax=viral metagenome TaxID=1070528 RepID=A0A6M3KXJ5_9ZZZZ
MPEHSGQRWKGIMKCYPFEESRLAKWNPPYIVQPKYDGVRCRAIPLESGYILVSSEENVIYSVPHINESLGKSRMVFELDGELYCHGMSFEQIVSITSRTVNLHSDHQQIQFHLFDVVNDQPQMHRQLEVDKLLHYVPNVQVAPFWMCDNLEDIMRAYDKLISTGYEGIIVRNAYAPYERKRSLWVMKFKPKKEDTYEIIGWKEEVSIEGNPKGRLGALVCKSGDGNTFAVGSGFNEDMREMLWKDKESLCGKSATVSYQHITSGKQVPRFPVFVEITSERR